MPILRKLIFALSLVVVASTTNAQQPFVTEVGWNYQLRNNVSFDFGVIAGRFVASPRAGIQVGMSVDW